ncbi:MAG: hypothetical protein E7017_03545 [Alphaproteobacteria bacterium]|nr:hypothetical protein [Alphaproteobacteria bacterium]
MKSSSLIAVLTVSTMLTSCSSGGGGGHYVPQTTLPNIPETPSTVCEGLTCMTNDGLSNETKRNERYSKALSAIGIARFSRSTPSVDDVNSVYNAMKTLLVDSDIDENDADTLRAYLILAGFEELPETSEELKDWISIHKDMIKRHAKRAYDMYGRPGAVYLDNVRSTLVGDTAKQDSFINFTIDENNDIKGIEIAENDFGAEYLGITLNKNDNDKFNGRDIVHTYEFPSQSTGRSLYIEVSGHEENETPSLALIKEKLKLKLQERAAEDSIGGDNVLTTNMTTILAEIDALTSLDGLEHEIFSRKIDATYTSYAKNLKYGTGNLLYSDFGLIDWKEKRTYAPDDLEDIVATRVFAGGYDAMKVEPDASQNLHFEGDAVGGVNYTQINDDEDVIKTGTLKLEGKATLDFNQGEEVLTANFDNWYDVNVTKNSNNSSITFSNGDKEGFGTGIAGNANKNDMKFKSFVSDKFDADLATNVSHKPDGYNEYTHNNFIGEGWDTDSDFEGYTGAMDIGYYGKDGTPSEATGYVMYYEETPSSQTDHMDILQMQIGVGMQKK